MYGFQADQQFFAQIWLRNPLDVTKVVELLEVEEEIHVEMCLLVVLLVELVLVVHCVLCLVVDKGRKSVTTTYATL